MGKVKFSVYNRRNKREKKGIPFVITPGFKSVGRIISQNLYILYMNEEVESVLTPAPMIYFLSARKLSCYLVRAKLYPLERTQFSERETVPNLSQRKRGRKVYQYNQE